MEAGRKLDFRFIWIRVITIVRMIKNKVNAGTMNIRSIRNVSDFYITDIIFFYSTEIASVISFVRLISIFKFIMVI